MDTQQTDICEMNNLKSKEIVKNRRNVPRAAKKRGIQREGHENPKKMEKKKKGVGVELGDRDDLRAMSEEKMRRSFE